MADTPGVDLITTPTYPYAKQIRIIDGGLQDHLLSELWSAGFDLNIKLPWGGGDEVGRGGSACGGRRVEGE